MEENQEREQADQEPPASKLSGVPQKRFKCIMNVVYHDDRERYYSAFHKFLMFLVVIFGFAAFGFEMGDIHLAPLCTFLAGAAGTVDLVFDVDGKARLHANLKRRYVDLRSRLQLGENPEDIEVELIRTSADEPPVMHAVLALAHNATVDIMGLNTDQKFVLTPMQIILRHFWPYKSFPTERDIKKSKRQNKNSSSSGSVNAPPTPTPTLP